MHPVAGLPDLACRSAASNQKYVKERYKPEEIVGLLRQAEVLHGQGMSMVAGRSPGSPRVARPTVGTPC